MYIEIVIVNTNPAFATAFPASLEVEVDQNTDLTGETYVFTSPEATDAEDDTITMTFTGMDAMSEFATIVQNEDDSFTFTIDKT